MFFVKRHAHAAFSDRESIPCLCVIMRGIRTRTDVTRSSMYLYMVFIPSGDKRCKLLSTKHRQNGKVHVHYKWAFPNQWVIGDCPVVADNDPLDPVLWVTEHPHSLHKYPNRVHSDRQDKTQNRTTAKKYGENKVNRKRRQRDSQK